MTGWLRSLFGKKGGEAVDPVEENGDPTAATEPSSPESDAAPIHATDETFEDMVLNASQPALVDFWADWCGPCRMMAPSIADLAKQYDGQAVIAKVDTDENRQITERLGIQNLPTVVLFKNGEEVERLIGYESKRVLEEKLDAILD